MSLTDVLAQSGVRGMKWGVRRSDAALGAAKKAREKDAKSGESSGGSGGGTPKSSRKQVKAARKASEAAEKQAQGTKGKIKRDKDKTRFTTSSKKLTNEELNTRIKRMETEKRYNDLNKRTVSTGEKMVVDVLKTAGSDTAKRVLTGAATLGVKVAVEKQFGADVAAGILPKVKTPKKDD